MDNEKKINAVLRRYQSVKGFPCDIQNPKRFTEKIQWKKINDRNPLIPITSDKYRIYDYIEAIGAPVKLPRLLQATQQAENLNLEGEYIVKANHGSGWNISSRSGFSKAQIVKTTSKWLKQRYAPEALEWGYESIEPYLVVQELLKDPLELKCFVFNGVTTHIQHNRYKPNSINTYTREWEPVDVTYVYAQGEEIKRPAVLDEVLETADLLGTPFQFVRVDFMISEGEVYLGEMTHYPTSGCAIIKPPQFEFELGKNWII